MKKCLSYKKLLLLLFACIVHLLSYAQYWQQKVDFRIEVTLNDKEKSLDAFEKINYFNQSPDTLKFIWFHLWPNAYKNDRTAFSDQMLEDGNTIFYFSNKEEKGYINRLDFKVDGLTAKTEDHPNYIDIVKLVLPKPLPPGQQISITTPFHVKLPYNFSRGGYDGETFQVTQWFPKPALYDKNGWHEMPYLDQGEFYSDFGDYDVRITLPAKYIVAATGELKNETIVDSTKTLMYQQNMVHDFAWFADKKFQVSVDSVQLSSGKMVTTRIYHHGSKIWSTFGSGYLKNAISFYSNEIGEYPYNTVSVVEGPKSFGGGMEYPTITVISPVASEGELEQFIVHEVGHNWFQGILATNERDYPWMDEGLNTFYEEKYTEKNYGPQSHVEELVYFTKLKRRTAQPISTRSQDLYQMNYFLTSYHATAASLRSFEKRIGKERFSQLMKQYYEAWRFKHPQPEDFKKIFYLEDDLKPNLGYPQPEIKNEFRIVSPFKKNSIRNYLREPSKDILLLSPMIGVNRYDKFMIGGLISNYKLPPNNFQYLFVPLYATGSKEFRWLGKLNYTIMSPGAIRKTDVFLNSSSFSMDDFVDSFDKKHITGFWKTVPGIRFTFKEKTLSSPVQKYIQWKSYFINEQNFDFGTDTVINQPDTSYFQSIGLKRSDYYINQLKFNYENSRALYPHEFNVVVDQSKDFIRPTITGNYFFNYREGGLNVRLFAGKFFYLGEKTTTKQFDNERYSLNMTGANGYEDYTYSDYFIGRNEFEGISSQQIIMRDGGFKVRTDLLSSKIGKTDNWLAALNFNTSVPKKINPLSVLPIKIPLHLFFDLGTYAEAWDKNAEGDRFLYDFGLHIPLFNEMINFYFPILYNQEYSDYLKSTIPKNRFFKSMSFTINLYNKDIQKLNRELEF